MESTPKFPEWLIREMAAADTVQAQVALCMLFFAKQLIENLLYELPADELQRVAGSAAEGSRLLLELWPATPQALPRARLMLDDERLSQRTVVSDVEIVPSGAAH